jgi:hypothetical protein
MSSEVFEHTRRVESLPITVIGLTVRQTGKVENASHSTIYERLARGEYDAIKDGKRTLITIESIERRRKATLTPAKFKPLKPKVRSA